MKTLRTPIAFLSASLLAACTFDVDLGGADGVYFGCVTDEDCVGGFFCDIAEGNQFGACVSSTVGPGENCRDNDSDNAFAGDCPDIAPGSLDCNDNDATIRPGAEEICDGVDNDCDGQIDEDIAPRRCPLQLGVCAGSVASCVDGRFQDCAADGVYPETFQATETACDGLDNDCDGTIDPDPPCECDPAVDSATECGVSTGTCTRGIQICGEDRTFSGCFEAREGLVCTGNGSPCETDADCSDGTSCGAETCVDNDDCGTGGYCVSEILKPDESADDDCRRGADNAGCLRQVCRYLYDDVPCGGDEECADGETCVGGSCQRPNIVAQRELCNGLDDNCDGRIDDDVQRAGICGTCPFNMVLVPLENGLLMCVDRYEASRPDATATSPGQNSLFTLPRSGVIPWTGLLPDEASAACGGRAYSDALGTNTPAVAVKQLCTTVVFDQACGGTNNSAIERIFPYAEHGATREEGFTAGACVDSSLSLSAPALTGATPECCFAPNPSQPEQTTCDMVGNVAEWVRSVTPVPQLAGGSFLSELSGEILACDRTAPALETILGAADIGFRCCTPVPTN